MRKSCPLRVAPVLPDSLPAKADSATPFAPCTKADHPQPPPFHALLPAARFGRNPGAAPARPPPRAAHTDRGHAIQPAPTRVAFDSNWQSQKVPASRAHAPLYLYPARHRPEFSHPTHSIDVIPTVHESAEKACFFCPPSSFWLARSPMRQLDLPIHSSQTSAL